MTNFDDFVYRKENIPSNYDKKKLFFANLKKDFYAQAKQTNLYAEYSKIYEPDSLEAFIIEYAEKKAYLAETYEYFLHVSDKQKEIKFHKEAMEVLGVIQQKKLFNLQLQWRAENIKIEGVNQCSDFDFWCYHIESCPFVPLVTRFDVDIAKKYLIDRGYSEMVKCYYDWQNYSIIFDKDEDGDINMPDWYDYYDQMAGTSGLLLLPDIRGKKEDYYADLGRTFFHQEYAEKEKQTPPPAAPAPTPANLFPSLEELTKFANHSEIDKHFVELFNFYKSHINRENPFNESDAYYDVYSAIDILNEADRTVYMPGGLPWKEAIAKCADNYSSLVISESLESVYDEYLMFTELKIARGKTPEEMEKLHREDMLVSLMTKFILKGRELSGEPLDFNF